MFTMSKEVTFHAAHRLPSMPEGHQCRRLHGHTYRVIITIGSIALDASSMLVDFGRIKDLVMEYDHGWLGEGTAVVGTYGPDASKVETVEPLMKGPSTAEGLAQLIGRRVQTEILNPLNVGTNAQLGISVIEVELWETPTSCVTVRAGEDYDPFQPGHENEEGLRKKCLGGAAKDEP
jgi:6-pyruvoyl-tetrahydropterin synthase